MKLRNTYSETSAICCGVATLFQAGISLPLRPSLTAAYSASRLKRAREAASLKLRGFGLMK